MNNPILWRLVWKEYRLMRSFWIAMAVITVLLEVLLCVTIWDPGVRVRMVFTIALALPAFYAMGCGATLFATEHETGTYQFQRSLPISAARLFFGKLPFGLLSTPLLFLLLWLSAWALCGWRLPRADDHAGLWRLCGVAAIEFFLWGVFFSLISKQPMKAAVLAAIAGSATIHFITMAGANQVMEIYFKPSSLPYRGIVASVVALADVWLGYRWLRDGSTTVSHRRRLGRGTSAGRKRAAIQRGTAATRATILGRLIWQQWRQSVRMMVVLSALVLPLVAYLACHLERLFSWAGGNSFRWPEDLPLLTVLALVSVPLAGGSVFLADQRRRSFRFLTERGVHPRHVWISRHPVWVLAVLLWMAVLVLPWAVVLTLSWMADPAAYLDAIDAPMQRKVVELAFMGGVCLAYVACAYTVGQLSSMFFGSGLLAGFFALLLSGGLWCWSVLMLLLGVPWIWSIAPIPIVLLVATWLRTPHWMLERNGPKGWFSTATWLVGTTGLLLAAVLAYRVYEVPEVDPGFSIQGFTEPGTSEARVTADMYRRAHDLLLPIASPQGQAEEETKEENLARRKAWIEANRESIDLAMKASRRADCDGYEPAGHERLGRAGRELGGLLVQQARLLNDEGDLDAALDRYLAALRIASHVRSRNRFAATADYLEYGVYSQLRVWASKPGQTPERIRIAIEAVERMMSEPPSQTDAMKAEYVMARQIIEGDFDLLGNVIGTSGPRSEAIRSVVAMQWMPWEKARAIRLLNVLTAEELRRSEQVERAVAAGSSLPTPSHYRFADRWGHWNRRWGRLSETTLGLRHFYEPDGYWEARTYVSTSTRRRATYLVLGLVAWKLQHGELPDGLDDLVGPYLSKLPPDPHTGEPFRYFREGIPIAFTETFDGGAEPRELLGAGEPFIWSTGWQITVAGSEGDEILDKYRINEGYYYVPLRSAKSEYEIWRRGEYFTIP